MFGRLLEVDVQSQVCANCEYWKGFRKPNESGQKAMITPNTTAKCNNKFSPWFDQVQLVLSTCYSWNKWSSLK